MVGSNGNKRKLPRLCVDLAKSDENPWNSREKYEWSDENLQKVVQNSYNSDENWREYL